MSKRSPIHAHSRRRAWITALSIAVLAAVSAYLVFEFGRIQAGYNILDAASERRAYEQRIAGLEAEIVALNEQVTLLETHRDIDREAYREVEASLAALQGKIQEQRDAIAFYRGIVSPEDGRAGLRVQNLRLTRGKQERAYDLRLVLVQSMRHDRRVSGNISLSIEGEQDGIDTSYTYSQLRAQDQDEDWAYSFRYFQDFSRQIILPDGFTPSRIKIEVRSSTRSVASIEASYPWARTLS